MILMQGYKLRLFIIKIMPKLKGKEIKDYIFGDCLVQFEEGSQIAKAVKAGNMNLTVYGISNQLIDPNTFVVYNEDIVNNTNKIYPAYYEIVRSQNFLYLIFEQLEKPQVNNQSAMHVQHFVNQLQKIYYFSENKVAPEQIFSKVKFPGDLCVLPQYHKNMQKSTVNMYSKFHNKSMLTELFLCYVPVTDKQKVSGIFMENIENNTLFNKLEPFIKSLPSQTQAHNFPQMTPPRQPQSQPQTQPQSQPQTQPRTQPQHQSQQHSVSKSNANKLLKQMQQQYPQIDDNQFEQLLGYVHVNPSLKHEAGQAYMRQSVQNRKQEAGNQINYIVDNINSSLFNVKTTKDKNSGKSKVQIVLNKKKLEISEFQVHFEAHYSQFTLLKKAIRSYLEKYKSGFSGIIAAYFLALIGILRKLQIYTDLSEGQDIYEISCNMKNIKTQNYLSKIKQDLAKQARALVNLKNIIQNANMPYKTYEALMPYLEEDLQLISLEQTQNFCFYYMTVLLNMNKQRLGYHQIIVLQVMYILVSPLYSIVYSEQDMPQEWDKKYYELKKVCISAVVPSWSLP